MAVFIPGKHVCVGNNLLDKHTVTSPPPLLCRSYLHLTKLNPCLSGPPDNSAHAVEPTPQNPSHWVWTISERTLTAPSVSFPDWVVSHSLLTRLCLDIYADLLKIHFTVMEMFCMRIWIWYISERSLVRCDDSVTCKLSFHSLSFI